jgi:hypothetical protein
MGHCIGWLLPGFDGQTFFCSSWHRSRVPYRRSYCFVGWFPTWGQMQTKWLCLVPLLDSV